MRQTRLSIGNFGRFVSTNLLLSLLLSGFGAVDMLMVAPFGADVLAAIGIGELVTATAFAVVSGYADVYSTTLARQVRSSQRTMRRTNLLFANAALCLTAVFALASLAVGPVLGSAYPDQAIGQGVAAYVVVRFQGVGLHLLSIGFVEALKIRGYQRLAFAPVGLGFLTNIAGNALIVHTTARDWLPGLEAGIGASTVVAQLVMAVSAWMFWAKLPARGYAGARTCSPILDGPASSLVWFMRAGLFVGGRSLNDYISNLVPLLFIATMGAERAAAAAVATKIATLFYRVPQSCFGASLVFYSFTLDRFTRRSGRARRVRLNRLALYSGVPTAFFALSFLMLSDTLARLFGEAADPARVALLLTAYMVFLPAYFAEHFLAELLAAHRQDFVMIWPSTLATFGVALPLAYFAACHLESAFLAIASRGVAAVPLATYYGYRLRPHLADWGELTT